MQVLRSRARKRESSVITTRDKACFALALLAHRDLLVDETTGFGAKSPYDFVEGGPDFLWTDREPNVEEEMRAISSVGALRDATDTSMELLQSFLELRASTYDQVRAVREKWVGRGLERRKTWSLDDGERRLFKGFFMSTPPESTQYYWVSDGGIHFVVPPEFVEERHGNGFFDKNVGGMCFLDPSLYLNVPEASKLISHSTGYWGKGTLLPSPNTVNHEVYHGKAARWIKELERHRFALGESEDDHKAKAEVACHLMANVIPPKGRESIIDASMLAKSYYPVGFSSLLFTPRQLLGRPAFRKALQAGFEHSTELHTYALAVLATLTPLKSFPMEAEELARGFSKEFEAYLKRKYGGYYETAGRYVRDQYGREIAADFLRREEVTPEEMRKVYELWEADDEFVRRSLLSDIPVDEKTMRETRDRARETIVPLSFYFMEKKTG